jgi:GNAT superfamily N-acetyltransferase
VTGDAEPDRAGELGHEAYGETELTALFERANDNAAGFWLAQARAYGWESWRSAAGGLAAVRARESGGERHLAFVLRDPGDPGDAVGACGRPPEELLRLFRAWGTRELKLEDPYRVLDLTPYGCGADPDYSVMARPPAGVDAASVAGVAVLQAADPGVLAAAEQVVVEGFPVPDRRPWRPGVLFPPELLDVPGARVWLAYLEGVAAAACVTYDDGAGVGVYWVATLPECRRRGVGRALLSRALEGCRDRAVTLTATAAGVPLYRGLGFVPVGCARWWYRSGG